MLDNAVVYSKTYEKVNYGPNHPLQPERFSKTFTLIKEAFPNVPFVEVEDFPQEVLRTSHSKRYIDFVKKAAKTGRDLSVDTPAFDEIFEWGFESVKGSLTAGKLILDDKKVVFNPSGGWHHAKRNSGGGFCVFNDVTILAKFLVEKGRKPVIIDIDAHAGNGTMDILKKEAILKISIHQEPAKFYPGEGFINEVGESQGKGYTVNIPLPPASDDGSLLYVFDHLVKKLLEHYNADTDVILLQSGVDGHRSDPITNLRYTGLGYVGVAKRLRRWRKPIVMMGGGGYHLEKSPKLWAGIFGTLIGEEGKAKEIMQEVDERSEILSEEPYIEMAKEVVDKIIDAHPFFEFN